MNKMLLPYDIVGGSFWLISVGMIGATLFFFFERSKVSTRFHTPMTMIAVVCLMSSIHYFFVKNLWVVSGTAPTLLRYSLCQLSKLNKACSGDYWLEL